MAHQEQIDYCLSIKEKFPEFFKNKFVLDIGSLDINGSNQYLFDECGYLGVDLLPGKNIDIVSKGHELNLPDSCFDVIISTECFEHDPFYEKTIKNIYRMLKPGGLLLFSCATTGRPEHGTRLTTPHDAPFTHDFGEWGDYYKNLEESDVRLIMDVDISFSTYEFSSQHKTNDLYFWGVKTGDLQIRSDYSFLLSDSSLSRVREKSKLDFKKLESAILNMEDELSISQKEIKKQESVFRTLTEELQEKNSQIEKIHKSHSWRLTKPLRFCARLARGEFHIAFAPLIQSEWFAHVLIMLRRIKNGLAYLARGDFSGLRSRVRYLRKEATFQKWKMCGNAKSEMTWGILTPEHTLFVAQMIADQLTTNGWSCEVLTTSPKYFSHDLYVVLCPQAFEKLPPGEKRIAYQMEQSVSSRWFTDRYYSILENSLAVLDYSLVNLEFLDKKGIAYPHVHYLPVGCLKNYGEHVDSIGLEQDVLFYGDSLSSPRRRRMLDALQKRFNVRIINNIFGEDMIRSLKQSKVVVNIHYYENALLEMPRIQECLSLGLQVVSEISQDQSDYPELGAAVQFFEQDSIEGMIASVERALLKDDSDVKQAVDASQKRFSFMFNRFLVAMGFLPASHTQSIQLVLPEGADTFGLSLPETINRRRIFEMERPAECVIFDGIRRSPGWMGCGLSYAALAKHALDHEMKSITVMEDDVILPLDYAEGIASINAFLKTKGDTWDVFAGVIASLHPDTQVLSVEDFDGRKFVTINKMTSTVFNIYSTSALKMFCKWDPENLNSTTNTIDRFLETQKDIRVVVVLPFFVGHREEMHSTLWGFKNTQYVEMINESENRLTEKVNLFLTENVADSCF